ncbi:PD-(D/E)XK motif protein [Nocardiopsis halotolerans]|uniref:PD-(D/E)XK motif protein n=1 Tax=Nocardiopsis halotolerans TaxID=124252 RepID=UPI000360EB34|nr:PD-(D/E)XK motif protein [Nocardiopsis halotolerans]
MTITEALWRELDQEGGTGDTGGWLVRRLYPDSEQNIWIGVSRLDGRRRLTIRAPRPAFLKVAKRLRTLDDVVGIELDVISASTLHVVLNSLDLSEPFTALASDLAQRASRSTTAKVVDDVLDQYALWRRMLKEVGRSGLGREARRGLFGELYTLRHHLIPAVGAADAVEAWTGPDGTNQDFQLPECAVEAKCTANRNPAILTISDEKQLDRAGAGRLFLSSVVVDERRGGVGTSLRAIVEEVRNQLPVVLQADFEQRLAKTGYLGIHAEKYDEPRYTVTGSDVWEVSDGFPCLTVENIPAGISGCIYKIDTRVLAEYACDADEFRSALRSGSGQ